jgi:hypothetical protein
MAKAVALQLVGDEFLKRASRDLQVLVEVVKRKNDEPTTSAKVLGQKAYSDYLLRDGCVDRLLGEICAEFARAGCRDALVLWLTVFPKYLDLHLPATAHPLYRSMLRYLAGALFDLDEGVVRPPLKPLKINQRPRDDSAKLVFKATCVIAANLLYEAAHQPGKKRPKITRKAADESVRKQVSEVARRLGLESVCIASWRKDIKKAPMRAVAERRSAFVERHLAKWGRPERTARMLVRTIADRDRIIA